ncbi:hypothetical protein CJ026_002450 [Ralstonia pickettii]|jgi:hypothetical protein|uniref:Uncharacterized protein n=1 Tax=Ralstonia pickettii TaxID=329 RepID=A0ABN9I8M3_RALPI|nr:hypothetical protein [Cyanobacteria bacterium DS2.008]MBA4274940.1 hypothetical protein [Alphaproteobacteria bacterium]POH85872.1 hypothetical protein CJ026_002450 [Ralstonia pickettii]CAJ0733426.1 hypothetical protein R38712_05249 [Ralstonia pickettii]
MEWLEPWSSTQDLGDALCDSFVRELQSEVARGHAMFGLPIRLVARGEGDDALFEITDGSSRVAVVHLTWSKVEEVPPWPESTLYSSIQEWAQKCMLPEHEEWKG